MAFLLVKGGPEKGRVFEIGAAPVTLGRDKNQTVQILDQGVSRAHAEIFRLGELFVLRDISSTNGTYLNTERISEEVLKDGDEILIGNTLMRFQEKPQPPMPSDADTGDEYEDEDKPEIPRTKTVELAVDTQFGRAQTPPGTPAGQKVQTIDSRSIQVTYEVGRLLTLEGNVEDQVTRALEVTMKAIDATQAWLLLIDPKEAKIKPHMRVSRDTDSGAPKLSRAIVRHVGKIRRPTLCTDATVDDRFTYSESIVFRKIHSVICVPLFAGQEITAAIYFHKPETPSFTVEDLELVSQVALQISLAIETSGFQRKVTQGPDAAARALTQALELFDSKGYTHAQHVADYSQAIATQLGLDRTEIHKIRLSALLHDIGKLSSQKFEESRIVTPGKDPVTAEDARHVFAGEKIVLVMDGGKELVPGVKFHHERFDGTGYPYKAKNAELPLMARIVIVANAFENEMNGPGSAPVPEAVKKITERAGSWYDPEVAKALAQAHLKELLVHVPDLSAKP